MKTALITGASSGIGQALAEQFAKENINLIIVARRTELLQGLAKDLMSRYPIQVNFHTCDLTDLKQIDAMVIKLAQSGERINYLINNAGMGLHGNFDRMNPQDIIQMLLLNIVSLTYLTRCFLDQLANQAECRILNVASTAAFQPCPYLAVYGATKAYVLSFSEAIAMELQHRNIVVTALCPGETETDFITLSGLSKLNRVKNESLPTAADVAAFALSQLLEGRQLAIYGWKNRLMVFGERFIPRKLIVRIAANLYK